MNGSEPKIEIFKPFGEAIDLTKKILFQPFDLKKWFVIGFAAFLSNLSGGFNFNFGNWNRSTRWHAGSFNQTWNTAFGDMDVWIVALIIAVVFVVIVAIAVVLAWLGARGHFIFTDCIVKNRGAIVEPWHEFRKEGNSFFLFSLLVGFVFVVVTALLCLPFLIPLIRQGKHPHVDSALLVIGIVLVALVVFLLALAWALISHLMIPVMYRRRCMAREAFGTVASLITAYSGEIVLYCLFLFVLLLASALIGCVSVCVTCCIAAIPYVGTVILLPIFVVLRSFSLLFLRQFGPDYDVWAGIAQIESAAPSSSLPPPIQT